MKHLIRTFLILLFLLAALCGRPQAASAQGETPDDLIAAVNALRASEGLSPYQPSAWLMTYAQEHADYLAELQHGTHVHRDGTLPWDHGINEDVASGDLGYLTPAVAVNEVWADWGHRHPLTGYGSGEIGAGIALAADGQIYYVVEIRAAAIAPPANPDQKTALATAAVEATSPPFTPYAQSTPQPGGSIIHTVGPGQTLWGIAITYGVTVADLRRLNGLPEDSTFIVVGQPLLVRAALSPTPSQPAEAEAQPPAATLRPTRTAAVESTRPAPGLTATPAAAPPEEQRKQWGIGLALGSLAAVAVLVFALRIARSLRSRGAGGG